jgi:hypothetical protein
MAIMADFAAIGAVSSSLKTMLEQAITLSTEPQLAGTPIDLRSPKELRTAGLTPVVSLWLYRITRNDDLINLPALRVPPRQILPRPFPVNLHYLITPMTAQPIDSHRLLGRVLQIMHDTAILGGAFLDPSLVAGGVDQLRIHFEPHSLEELTRVWYALHEHYDLSCSYIVEYLPIASQREPVDAPPVLVAKADYAEILEER